MKPLDTNQSLRLTFHRAIRAALIATMLLAAPLGLPSLSHAQKWGVSPEEEIHQFDYQSDIEPNQGFYQSDLEPEDLSLQETISELEANLCAESPKTPAQVPTVDQIQSQMEATTGCLDCANEQALAQTRPQAVLDQVGQLLEPVEEALKKERIQNELEFFRFILDLTMGMGRPLPNWGGGPQIKVKLAKLELENIETGIKYTSESLKQTLEQIQKWRAQTSAIEKLESGRALDTAEKQRLGEVDLIKQTLQSAKESLPGYEEMSKEMAKNPFVSASDMEEIKRTLERLKKEAKLHAELEGEWGQLEAWSKGKEGAPAPSKTMRDAIRAGTKNLIDAYGANAKDSKESLHSLHQQAADARAKLKELEKALTDEKKKQETEGTRSTAKMTPEEEHAKFEDHFKDHAAQFSSNPDVPDCGMSVAETLALFYYTSDGYRELNSALREGGKKREKFAPFAKVLDAALKKLRPYEGIANRGGDLPKDLLENHQTEAIVTYKAFTSSSVASGFNARHRFTILSKSGRYIAPFSPHFHEQEVLFPANAKFRVLAREEKEPSQIHFVLEEILENEK